MALSPPLPRSPSNIKANSTLPKDTTTGARDAAKVGISGSKSLTVRSSASLASGISGAADQSSSVGSMPASRVSTDQEVDLAEKMNEDIGSKYVKGKKLGEGTFAIVYQGYFRANPQRLVAIKKFKIPSQPEQRSEGLNVDSIREIKYLQELSHPSIVGLLDVFSTKDETINMVIEYFPNGNLEQLIRDKSVAYGAADVKAWMGMLSRAIYFCHSHFVLHRDIKPNNLLIAEDGEVKLADFGLARSFADPYANMTPVVITLWYRPPELLFGARHYSGAVDVWSMGMVLAELLLRVPYAATMSDKEIAQLETICDAVGTPSEANWPGVSSLANYVDLDSSHHHVPVRGRDYYMTKFPTAGPQGVDLLMSMLKLDPRNRPSAKAILEHSWWSVAPAPTELENLPRQGGGSEKMARDVGKKPGVVAENSGDGTGRRDRDGDENLFPSVARKLDFSSMR